MGKLKKIYLNNRLLYDCLVLAILFCLNCFAGELAYLSFTVVGILVLTENLENSFSLLVFCIPFICLYMPISIYLFMICILIFEVKAYIEAYFKKKMKPSKSMLIMLGVFLIYCLLPIGEYNINLVVKLVVILTIISIISIFTKFPNILRLRFNLSLLSLSLLLSVIYCLLYFVSPYLREIMAEASLNSGFIRFPALFHNINELAMLCEICLSLLLYFVISKQATPNDIIPILIFSICGLATFSKIFIILFSIMLLILVIYGFIKYPFKTILWVTVGAVLVLCFVVAKSDFVIEYANRFFGNNFAELDFEEKLNVLTTTRYGLWKDMILYISDNPYIIWFGAGLGGEKVSIESPHNFFLTSLYNFGIIGLVLFVGLFVVAIRNFNKKHKGVLDKKLLIPLLIMCILFMGEDFFLYIR